MVTGLFPNTVRGNVNAAKTEAEITAGVRKNLLSGDPDMIVLSDCVCRTLSQNTRWVKIQSVLESARADLLPIGKVLVRGIPKRVE